MTENASIKPDSSNTTRREKRKLNELPVHYSAKNTVGLIRGRNRGEEKEIKQQIKQRGGFKLLSSGEELLCGLLHSRLSFISHSNPGAKSVTLINGPARNTNQYCRGIINPLRSQSPLQKVKLIQITFCWLIVAISWVKEGRLIACVPLSGIRD